ncbi:MAG TPA: fluoride efflux transporter CrcB [Spirochaetota bacterium]|nr:fluoride efflux transporter CrcB [Spirochaetota bacterium]
MKYFYIAIGGAIGSLSRYLLSTFTMRLFNTLFPLGTLIVNITGCFLIGFLFSFFEKFIMSPNIRFFVFVGLLGGFTTFSSFTMETFNLLREKEIKLAILNFIFNNFLGIIAVIIGFIFARLLLKLIIK